VGRPRRRGGGRVAHPRGTRGGGHDSPPEELTTIVILRRLPHVPKLPPFLRGMPIIGVAVCHAGVIEAGERAVQPLRAFGAPLADGISLKPYVEHQTMFDAAQPPGRHNYWKTSYLRELGDAAIDAIVDSARRMTSPLSLLALYQLGGAARLGEAAFCLNVAATWTQRPKTSGISPGRASPGRRSRRIRRRAPM